MMRVNIYISLFIAFVSLLSCSTLTKSDRYELRPYQEKKLSNGLSVLLIRDKSLPYFSLQLLVNAGSVKDPSAKAGLSHMVAQLLDKGTHQRTATKLADSLGQIAAEFNASVEADHVIFSASSLSSHSERLLNDFSEIIMKPTFAQHEITRLRRQVMSGLRNMVDDPSGFADTSYSTYIYGSHPYGKKTLGTLRDVQSISKKDIRDFYQQHYSPNNAILAVVGDYDENIFTQIEKVFGTWETREIQTSKFPVFPEIKGIQIRLVDKNDLAQSQIRFGHKAIKRSDSDFLKLRLASIILGGAFSSRLMKRVRVEKGLTYSINAQFGAQQDFGAFTVSTFTRHEKVGETIKETLGVLEKFGQEGATTAELDAAKALAKGLFARALETAEAFARNLLTLRNYGIGDDYLENYHKNIESISLQELNAAITKHLHPNDLKILVFAPKIKTIEQLRPLGLLEVKNFRQLVY